MKYLKKIYSETKTVAVLKDDQYCWKVIEQDMYGGGLGDLLEAYFELKSKKNPDLFDQKELKILVDGLNLTMKLFFPVEK